MTSNELLTEVERLTSQARAQRDETKARLAIALCEDILREQAGAARFSTMALQLRLLFEWTPHHRSVDQAFKRFAREVEEASYPSDLERKVARFRLFGVLNTANQPLTPAMQQWKETTDYRVTPSDLASV